MLAAIRLTLAGAQADASDYPSIMTPSRTVALWVAITAVAMPFHGQRFQEGFRQGFAEGFAKGFQEGFRQDAAPWAAITRVAETRLAALSPLLSAALLRGV